MTARPRVLVVDDESQILRALRVVLRDAGFEAVPASTAADALDSAAVQPPDAAIIDLVLPDGDGVEVTRRLRAWTSIPILVLSAVGDEEQKVAALDAGADDYLTKPFHPGELVARLRAVLRRATGPAGTSLVRAGDLEIDLSDRVVRVAGEPLHLTRTEYDLLAVLAQHPGRLMTHRALLTAVWGPNVSDDTQALRTHIANLRRKVESERERRLIRTESGVGYRFVV